METSHEHDHSPSTEPGSGSVVTVRDNDVQDQFELFVDDVPAGFLRYQIEDKNFALTHTEIEPEFEGRGMGSQLISQALAHVRAAGYGVLPYCPFVTSYLQRHTEDLDLVPARYRERFGLPSE